LKAAANVSQQVLGIFENLTGANMRTFGRYSRSTEDNLKETGEASARACQPVWSSSMQENRKQRYLVRTVLEATFPA
jgi:hypothetical protein